MEIVYDHLVGRPYVPGGVHCYTLVRDFFKDNFNLTLANYAVPTDWNSDELDLIDMIHEREGFQKLEDWSIRTLRPADVLCIAYRAKTANHLVINVGANTVLHHPLNKLSCTEPLRDAWRMSTCYVLRHPAVPDLRPEKQNTTIQELIDARYRVKAAA